MKSTVAAYIRVSTDDQIEFSPDSQRKALLNYAEKNNMYLPNEFIFVDEGISGKTTSKRPSFNKMIGLAKSSPKPFDAILVWKYSRFARNREDSIVYKSMLRKELGINVISISENVGDDKMSIIFEAMIEAMDEYYSINLAEEVKRGMTEKAFKGGVLSIPPFGYKANNGVYEVVPSEAAIIRKVFNDYINGKGFLSLAKELNAMGVKTHRGNQIENRTIEYWLNNPTYIGKTRWNPTGATSRDYHNENVIISNGTHKAIIDPETWDLAQSKMAKQKEKYNKYYTSPRRELSHWSVGIFRCGVCGATMSNMSGHFSCCNKYKGTCKGNGGISVNKFSQIVLGYLEEILISDKIVINTAPQNLPNASHKNADIEILELEIKRAEAKLERIKTAYNDGVDTLEEYKQNKKSTIKTLEELRSQLDIISQKEDETTRLNPVVDKEKIRRLVDILKDKTISNVDKNSALRTRIKEIVKTGDDGKTIKIVFWE